MQDIGEGRIMMSPLMMMRSYMAMIDKMRQVANMRLPNTVCQLNIFSCRKIIN